MPYGNASKAKSVFRSGLMAAGFTHVSKEKFYVAIGDYVKTRKSMLIQKTIVITKKM